MKFILNPETNMLEYVEPLFIGDALGWLWEKWTNIADAVWEWEVDVIGGAIGGILEFVGKGMAVIFKEGIMAFVRLLNTYSVEIITMGVIVCGFGMMIAPISKQENKWFGRLFTILMSGVIWRMII